MTETPLSYQKMFEQVEEIIARMQNENLDLDAMIQEVRLGHSYLQKMRQRLKESENTISEIKNELLGESSQDSDSDLEASPPSSDYE